MENTCVFCDKTKIETNMIHEDNLHYVVATLGQIPDNGGYALLIPKLHSPCLGSISDKDILPLYKLQNTIGTVLKKTYDVQPIMFEHGIVGQSVKHTHLHFVPETCTITEKIKSDFPQCTIQRFVSLKMFIKEWRKKQLPYLLWQEADGILRVCWNPDAPPQYMRLIVAESVGKPERGDWKNAGVYDKWLIKKTVDKLKPYF